MLGPAGDSALSSVPSAPSRPGSPAAALSVLPSPAFTARAAERWPPTSLRLAAFLPAGRLPRVREGAARASRIGRARGRGRARNQRAHRQPGARGSQARGAPRGPAAAPASFRLRRGLRRGLLSVTGLGPGGAASSHPGPPTVSAPIRTQARANDLVSRRGCGRRPAGIQAPASGAGRESEMKRLSPGNTYPSPVQVQLPRSSGAAGPRPRAPGSVLLTMSPTGARRCCELFPPLPRPAHSLVFLIGEKHYNRNSSSHAPLASAAAAQSYPRLHPAPFPGLVLPPIILCLLLCRCFGELAVKAYLPASGKRTLFLLVKGHLPVQLIGQGRS